MTAPDSSVLIAGFVRAHQFHDVAAEALVIVRERGRPIGHTIAETFSVLSSPGGIYRVEPGGVRAYLDQFPGVTDPAPVTPGAYREAVDLMTDAGRGGGAIYDALIAVAARDAEVTLVSLDRKAQEIYERCGASVRYLGAA